MLVTSIPFAGMRLLLAAAYCAAKTDTVKAKPKANLKPKIVAIDWLADDEHWPYTDDVQNIALQHKMDESKIQIIDENSLSKKDQLQILLSNASEQLHQYASGKRQRFELPLALHQGTEFQQRVWRALQKIGYGETISYAQLAKNIGQPTAYRAVANANGKNPFSIVVPCHRVIASGRGIGGYTGGLDKKRLLLAIESQNAR